MDYYIIGGGLSGLRIASLLAKDGHKVEVFEAADQVGGLLRTVKKDGFLFDLGPHVFFREYADEYRRLLGDSFHNIKALYGIGFKGRDIISPIRPLNLINNIGIAQSMPLVADVLHHKLLKRSLPADRVENAEQWVLANFGRQVYRHFFKNYIPKVTGLPASMVSREWGTERSKFYKEHNLWRKSSKFILDFFINKKNKGGFLDVYYPENGAQQVTDALAREITGAGGRIRLGTSVSGIELSQGKAVALTLDHNQQRENIRTGAGMVINTMPVTELFKTMHPNDPGLDQCRQAAARLRFRELWLFNMIIKRDKLKDKAQIYFPERGIIFKRVYEPKNLMVTPVSKDKTAVCVEVCFNRGDEIDGMGERGIFAEIMKGFKSYYQISEEDVLEMWSEKVPYAYAVYEQGYRQRLEMLAGFIFNINNLVSFGRQGSFRYNHMTNRVMDACALLQEFCRSGMGKSHFLRVPDAKSDFF